MKLVNFYWFEIEIIMAPLKSKLKIYNAAQIKPPTTS